MKLSYLRHILETKGLLHGAERLAQVVSRFSQGRRNFSRMISCLEKEFLKEKINITFCVSASVLKRHEDLIRALQNLGFEIAAHGYYHTRMTNYSKDQQVEILKRTHRVFGDLGVSVKGFRCPYLNVNQDTIEAFQSSPYLWTSQELIFGGNGLEQSISRLSSLYRILPVAKTLSLPKFKGKVLEIPITAPDDEMLYERCRVRDSDQISKTWLEAFDKTYQDGELFHLLFHPERFAYIKDAILRLIQQAKTVQPLVWTPSVQELATWWRKRAQIEWKLQQSASGGWTVRIKSPNEATILLKSPNSSGRREQVVTDGNGSQPNSPIYKDYVPLKPIEKGETGNSYLAGNQKKHLIGISLSSPDNLEQCLREEGFLVERSENPQAYSLFMSGKEKWAEAGKRSFLEEIDACQEPLLRIWRWPNKARAACVISSDVDSITLRDFIDRIVHF